MIPFGLQFFTEEGVELEDILKKTPKQIIELVHHFNENHETEQQYIIPHYDQISYLLRKATASTKGSIPMDEINCTINCLEVPFDQSFFQLVPQASKSHHYNEIKDMVSQYNMENPSRPFKIPTARQIKYNKSLFLKNAKDKSLEEISPTPTLLINNSVITNNDFLLNATGSKIVESHQYQAADKDERIDLLIQENEKLHSTVNILSEAIDDKDQELKNVIMESMEADEALMEAGEDSKIHDNCNRNLIRRLKYAHKVEMDKVKYTPETLIIFLTT